MAEYGLTEVELVDKDTRVRVSRGGHGAGPMAQAPAPAVREPPPPPPQAIAVADTAAAHPGAVTSPMVGVAFLSPEPGAPQFVTVGQSVSAGQTLLLIEAMKTFNQIKAARAGTVTRIVVQNSSPVEFGELLMIVE